ncbi:MAG: soluble lytic murein transglycosylase [Tepidanaerobacteraceae bacterium]|nr:soluble lytic murein transglycosylase [Tepidanaerobacteraceae bacterium]
MLKKVAAVLAVMVGIAALYNNFLWFMKYLYPLKYEKIIVRYAKEYGVDPYMIAAVIKVESGFSPNVVSDKGAVGLMQIMPDTAQWAAQKMNLKDFKIEELVIPEINIKIGTWYLTELLKEFDKDFTLTLAAYNGGRGNVREWIKSGVIKQKAEDDIPFGETKAFVAKVKKAYKWYKRLYRLDS